MVRFPEFQRHVFWGKHRFENECHYTLPLAAHCLDVGLVFRHLTNLPKFRESLQEATGKKLRDRDFDRLSVIAMLHDLGKANIGFQLKVFDQNFSRAGHIRPLDPLINEEDLSQKLIKIFCEKKLHLWFEGGSELSYLIGAWSHHGLPLLLDQNMTGDYFTAKKKWWVPYDGIDPYEGICEILDWAERAFPMAFEEDNHPLPEEPFFHHIFAGMVMLSDWLGSHPYWFPIEECDFSTRFGQAKERIPRMLKVIGIDPSDSKKFLHGYDVNFKRTFGHDPRPLQEIMEKIEVESESSRLLIAESETGSGKTESALLWFLRLFQAGKVDGLFFGLPTRVAAIQMYDRVKKVIERVFPERNERPSTVLAIPGYPLIDGLSREKFLPDIVECQNLDEEEMLRRERFWAIEHPKRFLSAPVVVGTIDQALLSSIQTSHAHLRSVCLMRKLLVVDEVHASDSYMQRLLTNLLKIHLSTGGYALLLSATLGSAARTKFLGIINRVPQPPLESAVKVSYPSLTTGEGKTLPAKSTGKKKTVSFRISEKAFSLSDVIPEVIRRLNEGGRVMVILNTVNRTIDFLKLVEKHPDIEREFLFACGGVICPHHGRFAPEDRKLLDQEVIARMGPESPGGPLLLIGTQTLEQSLDIDADFIVTDICPADVLLQRIGRLHRHERVRPEGLKKPECLVLTPNENDLSEGIDERGNIKGHYRQMGLGSVYEDLRVFQLTLDFLRTTPDVTIPDDNRKIIEETTHPDRLSLFSSGVWEVHSQKIEGQEIMRELTATYVEENFSKKFGEFAFNESGAKVSTRLGLDNLILPLDKEITSPFGLRIRQIVIPGHLKGEGNEDVIRVIESTEEKIFLSYGDKNYSYSRFGLEVVHEPTEG